MMETKEAERVNGLSFRVHNALMRGIKRTENSVYVKWAEQDYIDAESLAEVLSADLPVRNIGKKSLVEIGSYIGRRIALRKEAKGREVMRMNRIRICERKNLCVDCEDKSCSLHGKLASDCPKYRCDNGNDCENCEYLSDFMAKKRREGEG